MSHYFIDGMPWESKFILSQIGYKRLGVHWLADAPRKTCRSVSQEMLQCLMISTGLNKKLQSCGRWEGIDFWRVEGEGMWPQHVGKFTITNLVLKNYKTGYNFV